MIIETSLCFVYKKRLKHFSIKSLFLTDTREMPQTTTS